jgi:serine/threonine protein kinase
MGEVYKARDARLDRLVAIKVLPEHLAQNPEARQRFEREARAVSSLNHPNICTLHDIGHQDGIDYLVMEYLEGETLADRLARGPLLMGEVLRHVIPIADALAQAHRQGVFHRDLKPGNIMLTKTGAKLLDFGLAKSAAAAVSGATGSRTLTRALTAEGTILGTIQYMSPRAARRQERRRPQRHLRVGRRALRDGDGAQGLSWVEPGQRHRRHFACGSAAGFRCG